MSQSAANPPETHRVCIEPTADGGDRAPELSAREARDRWLVKIRASRAESTVSAYHYRMKHFVEWCEEQGITSMSRLNGWNIEEFEAHRRAQGLETTSLNNELGTLKKLLEYCARIEVVDESLPDKVVPPKVPSEEDVDDTRLAEEDALQLLDYYENNPDVRYSSAHVLLALGWFAGPPRLGAIGRAVARETLSYPTGEPITSMSRYEASFEIDSKTDSYAARRILERVYDTIREESQSVREGTDEADELLSEFRQLRDAAKRRAPGRLTITYEQSDDDFTD